MSQPAAMSYVARGCAQVCFVSRDLHATQRFLQDTLGVPGFRVFEGTRFRELRYRGQPADFAVDLSLGYAGDLQVEVIRAPDAPSVYGEFLDARGPGIHHLGYEVESCEQAVKDFAARGYDVVLSGSFGESSRFAYFDTQPACGAFTEVFEFDPGVRAMMAAIKRGEFA